MLFEELDSDHAGPLLATMQMAAHGGDRLGFSGQPAFAADGPACSMQRFHFVRSSESSLISKRGYVMHLNARSTQLAQLVAGLMLMIAMAPPLTAEEKKEGIEEIVVTAEFREATLQETDISMTVMNAKTLDEMGATTPNDIGDFVPNIKIHEMPGKMGAAIGIRGFRNGETISTFDPKVAVYLDGVLMSKSTGAAFDVLDLERIEVLRGPQGTLYGRNTVGGAINLITKKPTDELTGKIATTLGDYGQRDITATLNVPLVGPNGVLGNSGDSRLNLKATVGSLKRDGYWDNNFSGALNDDLGDKDREVGHVQLEWLPTEGLSFLYAYDNSDIDETGWPMRLTAYNPAIAPGLAPYVSTGGSSDHPLDFRQFMQGEAEGHSLTVDWAINDDLSLVSISAFRKFEVDNAQDSDGSPLFLFHTISGDEVEDFTQELRLVGSAMDSRLDYVAGAYYMDEDIKEIYTVNILPSAGYTESGTTASAKNEIWALFGEATYGLTERLDLTLGLRYTEEDREMSRVDTLVIPALGRNTATRLPDVSEDFENISGTVSLAYQWTDDIMTYAKVSRGYASGGFNPRAPDSASYQAGYDEETVWNYEIGWKTTWLDSRLQVNGAIFYADYRDLQVTVITAAGRGTISNASDAQIQGLELEVQARPMENLEIGAGYGYLDPEYKNYILPTTGQDVSNIYQWAQAPDNTFSAYGRYTVPDFLSAGDLVFRVDYSWTDDRSILAAPDNWADCYDLVNARVALNNIRGPGDTRINIALWGKNLTDQVYYTSGYNLTANLGFRAMAVSEPRTYGMDFVIEW